MPESQYAYDVDDLPPVRLTFVYGLQWAVITFPALIIVAALCGRALNLNAAEEVRFLQLTLLTSGFFTVVQTLWGHRYPVLDGPATALLLTFLVAAPYGLRVIQGGLILGGAFLMGIVLLGRLDKLLAYATPNIVGVILMLIAFTLLPHLSRTMIGMDDLHPFGEISIFLVSLALVIVMAALTYWLKGFWKTIALLMGIVLGMVVFLIMGRINWNDLFVSPWLALPHSLSPATPEFYWPAVLSFLSAYVAVIVNSLGSIQGIASITDSDRLTSAVRRGIFMNGLGGIWCGLLGIVGTVSYSVSPGVVLANRVASRYAVTCCGGILILAAFVPKLAALLALVPPPVVGAALCVAMGGQVGAGLGIIAAKGLTSRSYFVVGLPVLVGTLVGYLPAEFLSAMPPGLRVFVGNGLVVGIFLVAILEHLIFRERKS